MRTYDIIVGDKSFKVAVKDFSSEEVNLEVDGKPMKVQVSNITSDSFLSASPVRRATTAGPDRPGPVAAAPAAVPAGEGSVIAPIPGLILAVLVKVGDKVAAGQALLKMEAMKMENAINAPHAGTVTAIKVQIGDAVNQGQELIVVA